MRYCIKKKRSKLPSQKAQAVMEFTFMMIMVALLAYGTIKVWKWTGLDLRDRRVAHDEELTKNITEDADSPLEQIDPFFFQPRKMQAVHPNPRQALPFGNALSTSQ